MNPPIVDFHNPVESEASTPAPERILIGEPRQLIANYYSDATQQFHAGRWSSTPGRWRIRYTESEFCCLTSGRVALEDSSGRRWEFGVGDAFVVPAGFEGSWEVLEECTKFYALFEACT